MAVTSNGVEIPLFVLKSTILRLDTEPIKYNIYQNITSTLTKNCIRWFETNKVQPEEIYDYECILRVQADEKTPQQMIEYPDKEFVTGYIYVKRIRNGEPIPEDIGQSTVAE